MIEMTINHVLLLSLILILAIAIIVIVDKLEKRKKAILLDPIHLTEEEIEYLPKFLNMIQETNDAIFMHVIKRDKEGRLITSIITKLSKSYRILKDAHDISRCFSDSYEDLDIKNPFTNVMNQVINHPDNTLYKDLYIKLDWKEAKRLSGKSWFDTEVLMTRIDNKFIYIVPIKYLEEVKYLFN